MSTDDTDSGAEYRGPQLNTRMNATTASGGFPFSRSTLGRHGIGDRQSLRLYDAFNYPSEDALDFDTWLSYYYREGPVAGLLDKLVTETWQSGAPTVSDDDPTAGEDDSEDTDFESDVKKLFSHNSDLDLRAPILDRLVAADILATLGEYAVIVFGVKDDASVKEPLEEGAVESDGFEGLAYVEVYAEKDVDFDPVNNLDDERHGRPDVYEIENGQEVHHSRVVHVAENTLVDPYRGIPYFKPIVNLIVNIQKILGASGEGYFRGGHPFTVIQPPDSVKNFGTQGSPQVERVPGTFGDQGSELADRIGGSIERYERLVTANGKIETLAPNVSSPADHIDAQWAGVAAAKDLPQAVIKGNETGERATTEDSASLRRRVGSRRNRYAETRIYRPTLDLLAHAGVVTAPDGDGYEVEWAPLSELTEQEEADLRSTNADALATATGGQPDRAASIAEIRKEIMGWSPERGSEAPDDVAEQDAEWSPGLSASEALEAGFQGGNTGTGTGIGVGAGPAGAVAAAGDGGQTVQAGDTERANAKYSDTDVVEYDSEGHLGVVITVETSDFTFKTSESDEREIEASSDNPAYVVARETEGSDVYRESDLSPGSFDEDTPDTDELVRSNALIPSWYGDVEDPFDQQEVEAHLSGRRQNAEKNPWVGFRPGKPEGWTRKSYLQAWVSLGGSWRSCVADMTGDISRPKRWCSALKDTVIGHEYWRGRF